MSALLLKFRKLERNILQAHRDTLCGGLPNLEPRLPSVLFTPYLTMFPSYTKSSLNNDLPNLLAWCPLEKFWIPLVTIYQCQ
jgi:hypothetical protein